MSSLIVDVAAASSAAVDTELSRGALMVCDAAGSYRPATADEVLRHARQVLARRVRRGVVFDSPALVKDYLKVHLAPLEYEVFMVVFVDAQHRLIACEQLFRGTLTQTSVYPREVVKRALVLNAGAVVLAHNHPSGSVEPSRADELLTQTLKSALQLVDVRVLDHIVVAGDATTSFAERGLL
jgi:DNA repair protein RadC